MQSALRTALRAHSWPKQVQRCACASSLWRRAYATAVEDRYRDRLLQKAQAEGVKTIEELRQVVQKRQVKAAPVHAEAKAPSALRAGKPRDPLVSHTLEDIMDMSKITPEMTGTDIAKIWTAYHSSKGWLSAVATPAIYNAFQQRAKQCPVFILPLRGKEAEQWTLYLMAHSVASHQTYFTPLAEYHAHQAFAKPCFSITHYPDLAESHQIVLVRGDESVKDHQLGKKLVECMRHFYVDPSERAWQLVEEMNKAPTSFDYQKIIDEVEGVSLHVQ